MWTAISNNLLVFMVGLRKMLDTQELEISDFPDCPDL